MNLSMERKASNKSYMHPIHAFGESTTKEFVEHLLSTSSFATSQKEGEEEGEERGTEDNSRNNLFDLTGGNALYLTHHSNNNRTALVVASSGSDLHNPRQEKEDTEPKRSPREALDKLHSMLKSFRLKRLDEVILFRFDRLIVEAQVLTIAGNDVSLQLWATLIDDDNNAFKICNDEFPLHSQCTQ